MRIAMVAFFFVAWCAPMAHGANVQFFPPEVGTCADGEEVRAIGWDGVGTTLCITGAELVAKNLPQCANGQALVFRDYGRSPVNLSVGGTAGFYCETTNSIASGPSCAAGEFLTTEVVNERTTLVCKATTDPSCGCTCAEPDGGHLPITLHPSPTLDASNAGDLAEPIGSAFTTITVSARTALSMTCAATGTHSLSMGQEAQVVTNPSIDGAACAYNTNGAEKVWSWTFRSSATCTRLLQPGTYRIGCDVLGERINAPGEAFIDYTLVR